MSETDVGDNSYIFDYLMFHRYVRIVLIEMEQKLIVMCFEHIYQELRSIYSMAIFKGSGDNLDGYFQYHVIRE